MRMRGWLLLALMAATGCFTSVTLGANGTVDLVVAATTDVHGYIEGWNYLTGRPDTLRGLARIATIVDSMRRATGTLPILVDAGDMLQGTPLTYAAARIDTMVRHPVIAAMNAMGYDAAAIGNHEFDYGLATLDRAMRQANFPLLAANVYGPNGQRRFAAWTVEIRRGVKVGIVGATTPGAMVLDRDQLAGRLQVRDLVPDVRSAVRDARNAGAAVVIAVVHSGLNEPSTYDTVGTGVASENVAARLAREVPGIDVIVYGHTHKEMADTVIAGTLLMQPKNWATSLAVAQLRLERHNGRWAVTYKRGHLIQAVHHREDSQVLAVAAEGHRVAVRYAATVIGNTPVAWRADSGRVVATPLIDFVLDVERRASGAQLASTAVFSLDASLAPGPITIAGIAALYPYDNTLRAVRISGAQLREYLEHSARYFRADANRIEPDPSIPGYNYDVVGGVDYEIDVARPIGERVTRLEYQGKPVAATDTFTMAVSNFRQAGGGGFSMLHDAPVVYDQKQDIRELLIEEVRKRGILRPEQFAGTRWRVVNTRNGERNKELRGSQGAKVPNGESGEGRNRRGA
jgi:2',3'-cyclic-nucleotide 2'-phosphodiesterase/3'-nucleotidase